MSDTFTLEQAALGDLDRELEATRNTLKRVPDEHFAWKPHERSWSLGELAGHIANLPGWGGMIVGQDGFDMAASEDDEARPPPPVSRNQVLETWDENVAALKSSLEQVDAEILGATWTLSAGDEVVSAMPRALAFRMWTISHLVHHRAQLGVYLRLLDLPVPATYGPSADEDS